ncbi:MAG: UDP-glucose--hexose-1-phosphate uridylyltransferase [Candidatus Izemoplasmatales bacterium]
MKPLGTLLNELVRYAADERILDPADREYAINALLFLYRLDSFAAEKIAGTVDFFATMDGLIAHALERGLIEADVEPLRDNFEAKLMDCFLPRPAELDRRFKQLLQEDGDATSATAWFYRLSKATNYIKTARIAKNINYVYEGQYGPLDITINLSKPEKDPKLIALAKLKSTEGYPKCALCMENVGFYGTLEKAPRANHRVISLTLNGETDGWGLQYSPYAYFNEHCIVLKKEHVPMKVDRTTFFELVDFVDRFPHYLIGSNAGLPIVGGSILTHYHFQGGNYVFPIESARTIATFAGEGVKAEVLDWPMSVVRIEGTNPEKVVDAVDRLYEAWKHYEHPALGILRETEGVPHNTVTPILRRTGPNREVYVFYVVLRNNRATADRPYGLFHPREEYFHIKKENIGLIEVMGLAVLPGRLKAELDQIRKCLLEGIDPSTIPDLEKHLPWIGTLALPKREPEAADGYLKAEVGRVFERVLEDCGVFKTESRDSFLDFVERVFPR